MIQVTRETHEAPASAQQRLARAGGTNHYGEPNFRVVWGGSRLTWIGGRWTDRDASGNVIRETIELRRGNSMPVVPTTAYSQADGGPGSAITRCTRTRAGSAWHRADGDGKPNRPEQLKGRRRMPYNYHRRVIHL